MKVIIVLLAVLTGLSHEHNVPKLLQRINKALGLPKKSEVLWDILLIANNTNEITDLKERVDQLDECCNCTKSKEQVLLVATGYNWAASNWTNQSQVTDLNSPTNCSNLKPYPYAIIGGAGGVLNGQPIICGGLNETYTAMPFCYKHHHILNEWTLLGNLNTARAIHASALLNGNLWITGGNPWDKSGSLASTELVSQDGTISYGTPLPAARSSHCMVTLRDGRVMILGGSNYLWKNVLIFDASDNTFTNGTELLYDLIEGACTIFNSAMHENRPVVFAVGRTKKAQLLDYTIGNTWEGIPDLPTSPSSLVGAPSPGTTGKITAVALPTLTDDGVIVQYGRYFYQLNCNTTACNWKILEKELSLPVAGAVAMILPGEYTCE